jgi:3-hydroxybutyryl-CoA dehydratase
MDLQIGDSSSITEKITEEVISNFAKCTGDTNLVHLNIEYAKKTRFKKPIAHGIYIQALISRLLGTKLPGPGTILHTINTRFKKPVYPQDIITVNVTITEIKKKYSKLYLSFTAINQKNKVVVEGEVIVLFEEIAD